jgi:hypothetical protein
MSGGIGPDSHLVTLGLNLDLVTPALDGENDGDRMAVRDGE